jgi:glutamate synthase domain-containing protein 2
MKDFVWGRYALLFYAPIFAVVALGFSPFSESPFLFAFVGLACAGLSVLAVRDFNQKHHAVLANYPVFARFRYFFEEIRPELRQYFWETDDEELPYSRNQRAIVYQRAKGVMAVRPFGSTQKMYEEDHTWLNHSVAPSTIKDTDFRYLVGEGEKAYLMSVLNISGTSFGALSPPAIQSLNTGAKLGGFAHNTGEGGYSPYHQAGGGDTIWQISTGYFGCRTKDGRFDAEMFAEKARSPQVKMIEIKLSQGAKPGHGGMLLAPKVTPEIAATRGVPAYQDCVSPSSHSEFSTPLSLLEFAERLRELSGGKPVGIKLCIGHPWEFLAIAKAMVESGKRIDFVTVDGSEGGTGAAPVEFTDHLGTPLTDALVYVDNVLIASGLRKRVKIGASGKLVTAYDIVRHCALGADWVNMARPFMFTVGCIQGRACSSGTCPTGVATMDPKRYRVIDVVEKSQRVARFHQNTLHALTEMLEAAGLQHPVELNRRHIVRRLTDNKIHFEDGIFPKVEEGALLHGGLMEDDRISQYWKRVTPNSFQLLSA